MTVAELLSDPSVDRDLTPNELLFLIAAERDGYTVSYRADDFLIEAPANAWGDTDRATVRVLTLETIDAQTHDLRALVASWREDAQRRATRWMRR